MGIYDTLAANKQAVGGGVGNGGSFAQKKQMQANPVMQGRPSMGAPVGQAAGNMGMRPGMGTAPANPMAQMQQINKNAGMQGSRQQIQAKQLAQEQKAAQPQAGIGPSEPVVKSGLPTLQTPYDMQQNPAAPPQAQEQLQNPMRPQVQEPNPMEQQIMASKPDVQMGAVQNGGASGPMGTTMGQEDPRQQQYNTWLNGGGGENPYATPEPAAPQGIGGSGIENIMQRMGSSGMQRPQVMPRRRR